MKSLTSRQAAVIALLTDQHPAPVSSAALAARLGLSEGRLNVTLRSLHRVGHIEPVPRAREHDGGWTVTVDRDRESWS
jgi:hypothetical protein